LKYLLWLRNMHASRQVAISAEGAYPNEKYGDIAVLVF
jgi:hypothetical protein